MNFKLCNTQFLLITSMKWLEIFQLSLILSRKATDPSVESGYQYKKLSEVTHHLFSFSF